MLTIAGGIILGVLGLWVIIAIMGMIADNTEEIAGGCAVIIGLLIVIGIWAWLDSEWPEIDWIKTALALIGGALAILVAIGLVLDTPLAKRMLSRKSDVSPHPNIIIQPKRPMEGVYEDLLKALPAEAKGNLKFYDGTKSIVFEKSGNYIVFSDNSGIFRLRNADGSVQEFALQSEAVESLINLICA
jgi:hypothetical protein